MATQRSRSGAGASAIVAGTVVAIRRSPIILLVAGIFGVISGVAPDLVSPFVSVAGTTLVVVMAYGALGGHVGGPLLERYLWAVVATVIAVVLILLGLLLLILPGIYIALRLWLVTPAVVVGGAGPVEALSESWELMDGSMVAAGVFLLSVIAAGVVFAVVVVVLGGDTLLADLLVSAAVGAPAGAGQAVLYRELRG